MKKYILIIAYDGTHYSGWQKQPHKVTIQEKIEKALELLLHKKVPIFGAGRTDAGVHALGQVAHLSAEQLPDLASFNGALPPDIRIREILPVPEKFHARYSALSKIYHYHLWLEPPLPPSYRFYRYMPREKICLPLLKEGAKHFLGKLDFTSFANSARISHKFSGISPALSPDLASHLREVGSNAKTFQRTLYRLDVVEQEGGVRLEFEGDGFLYKMVRNIVGLLLDVASGKTDLAQIKAVLEAKDRRAGGVVAPAQGLFLMHVNYPLYVKS